MVGPFGRNKQTFLLELPTQRMQLHIAVTDALPCTATTSYSVVSVVLLVVIVLQPFMFLTESAIH